MKQLNKVTPYSIKRAVLVFGMAAATLLGGCKKDDPDPTPTKDIEIVFAPDRIQLVEEDAIKEILNSKDAKSIRTIYLVPGEGAWSMWGAPHISATRTKLLEPALKLSPKVKGKGDFNFRLGAASQVPEDSLWYVKNGWTINKQFQK